MESHRDEKIVFSTQGARVGDDFQCVRHGLAVAQGVGVGKGRVDGHPTVIVVLIDRVLAVVVRHLVHAPRPELVILART